MDLEKLALCVEIATKAVREGLVTEREAMKFLMEKYEELKIEDSE